MPRVAYLTEKNGEIIIEAPYDETFIRRLKEKSKTRRWDGERRAWIVALAEKQMICNLVLSCFPDSNVYYVKGATVRNLHTGEMS